MNVHGTILVKSYNLSFYETFLNIVTDKISEAIYSLLDGLETITSNCSPKTHLPRKIEARGSMTSYSRLKSPPHFVLSSQSQLFSK